MVKKLIAFRLEPEMLYQIDKQCAKLGMNRSEYIRRALKYELEEQVDVS
ncbi:MAG: ribbon-helix-helix protein, CopG family [Candidatus Njordarchaeales archaeon]